MERFRQAGLSYDPLALEAPPQGDIYNYQDGLAPFLRLKVTHKSRVWLFDQWTGGGKRFKSNIGNALLTNLLEARMKAFEWAKMLEAGYLPPTAKDRGDKLSKQLISVESVFNQYFDLHLSKLKTAREIKKEFDRYWDPVKQIAVGKLTPVVIQRWVNKLGEASGHRTANAQLTLFHAMLTFANRFDLIDLPKLPTKAVNRFRSYSRERFLSAAEFARLEIALAAHPNQHHADVIRMAILTGARRGNVYSMSWKHIDLDTGIWRVPARESKTGKSIPIALTRAAMEILMRRLPVLNTSRCEWVFPSSRSKTGHVEEVKKSWYAIRAQAGLDDVHFHDLRHTVASALGVTGANVAIIQKALGHATPAMSMKYTHLNLEPVRDAMEDAQKFLGVKPALLPLRENDELREKAKNVVSPIVPFSAPNSFLTYRGPAARATANRAPGQNANVQITGADQLIVEGKILTSIKADRRTRKAFYQKIGAQFQINSSEMSRILSELEQRGVIVSYREAHEWQVVKYALVEEIRLTESRQMHNAQDATQIYGATK